MEAFSLPAQLVIGCALAMLAGVGFVVFLPPRERSWQVKVLIATLTTAGVSVLTSWKVPFIGPLHGICWLAGLLATNGILKSQMITKRARGLEHLPKRIQDDFRAHVEANLFELPHVDAEKSIAAKRNSLIREHDARLKNGLAPMHDFIHCARDEFVAYLAAKRALARELIGKGGDAEDIERRIAEVFETRLHHILEKMLRLFEAVTGTREVWVAVRVLSGPAHDRRYATFLRLGKYNPDRSKDSIAIPENYGLPAFLRSEYGAGRGIVILGTARKSHQWFFTKNDERSEDRSVIAGPVIVKSGVPNAEKREMAMILYVNSPEPECFGDAHRDVMKCCTDTLSLFLSVVAQLGTGTQIAAILPLTKQDGVS